MVRLSQARNRAVLTLACYNFAKMISFRTQSQSITNWLWLVVFLFVLLILLGLRLYRLPESLLFFNDLGRDYNELLEWQQTGLPPLLGPQTSALPFNQSAFYFYLLFPGYVLSDQSAFASVYTWLAVTIAIVVAALWASRRHREWWPAILVSLGLVAIHPEVIIQSRFVWNPSFAFLATLVAVGCWLSLEKKWSRSAAISWGVAAAWAGSLSYSVVPVLGVMLLWSSGKWRQASFWQWGSVLVAGLFLNAPTVAFELRHNFTLTRLMLYGEKIPQSGLAWELKLFQLTHYLLSGATQSQLFLLGLSLVGVIGGAVWWYQKNQNALELSQLQKIVSLGLVSLGVTLLVPVAMHSHYIFGLLAIIIWIIALLPLRFSLLWLMLASLVWLSPQQLHAYFKPAQRTVSELEACAQTVCQQTKQPLFVSVQADFHPFHTGPEHRYFLKKAGCDVKKIESEPAAANTMAVVVDGSEYSHGKTAFHELTMFGNSTESAVITCQDNLQVHLLKR